MEGKIQLDMDRQEHILQMELMDVLTEISMPDNSDEEGEVHVAWVRVARAVKCVELYGAASITFIYPILTSWTRTKTKSFI